MATALDSNRQSKSAAFSRRRWPVLALAALPAVACGHRVTINTHPAIDPIFGDVSFVARYMF